MTLNMTLNILKKSFLYHQRMVKLSMVRKMCNSVNYSRMLKSVFEKSVESVKPKSLFGANKIELLLPNAIRVGNEFIGVYYMSVYLESKAKFDYFELYYCVEIQNRKCHLVGFGKAVLGMAVQMERVLGDTLVSGILSVPVGTNKKFAMDKDMQLQKNSVIEVYEGAKNNLPDANAVITAKKIFDYVGRLDKDDVLFVLISGGGSALLPMPVTPITLDEKINVIKLLASRGANINELNCVRIEISSIKGGKLALAARNAHKTISLIISDICGDPLNLIASGPTFIQQGDKAKAKQIIEKFDLINSIPESVRNCLSNSSVSDATPPLTNSSVHIIGNNSLAINVAVEEMKKLQVRGICLSKRIEGDVELLSSVYCKLAEAIYELASGRIDQKSFQNLINSLDETLMLEKDFCAQLISTVMDTTNRNPICLISGGEATVNVKGNGIGGRNQELALRIASNIKKNETISRVVFLSAGTDGIDGPCDGKGLQIRWNVSFYQVIRNMFFLFLAAGAVASLELANDCSNDKYGSIDTYINNNDSYNLLKDLSDGKYHIVTGHTGTNVMDLHFMVIPF